MMSRGRLPSLESLESRISSIESSVTNPEVFRDITAGFVHERIYNDILFRSQSRHGDSCDVCVKLLLQNA